MRVTRVSYDDEADALAVHLEPHGRFARTVVIDDNRNVDVDEDGKVIVIEVLFPSHGFQLGDIIERFGLADVRSELAEIERRPYRPVAPRHS